MDNTNKPAGLLSVASTRSRDTVTTAKDTDQENKVQLTKQYRQKGAATAKTTTFAALVRQRFPHRVEILVCSSCVAKWVLLT